MASQPFSQSISSSAGSDARTNVVFAIERLKEKSPQSIPSAELIAYVLPQHKRGDTNLVDLIKRFLQMNSKVNYDPTTDSYSFRPIHNIFNEEDLLDYLQKQQTAVGIQVRELKDGWPTVEETIDKLEKEHKLLVTRNKKEPNHARMVWANDPTLIASLDQEYKDLWEKIPLPSTEEVIRQLRLEGHTPAGSIPEQKLSVKAEKKPARKIRRSGKVTNVHMQGLFRDYSDRRPQAAK